MNLSFRTNNNGKFIYIESSGLDLGDLSVLSSELFPYGTAPKG